MTDRIDFTYFKKRTRPLHLTFLNIEKQLIWSNSHLEKTESKTFGFLKKKESLKLNELPAIRISDELNVFEVIRPSEPIHSRIICELLSPNGRHNKKDVFLNLFFNVVFPEQEYGKEKWIVEAEKEYFDIRIRNYNNTSIFIIENKSNWADDQPNQLYRYWYYGIYIPQYDLKGKNNKILYLSPNDFKYPSQQSMSRPDDFDKNLPDTLPEGIVKVIFFNDEIIKWLESCIEWFKSCLPEELNSSTYFYIEQYIKFWRGMMSKEVINQASDFFKEKDQWYSFLELAESKDEIRNHWFTKLKGKLNEAFAKNDLVESWSYCSWGVWDYRWYLTEYGDDSIYLWFSENTLHLWANPENHHVNKVFTMLQQKEYTPIISAFERLDEIGDSGNEYQVIERGNFIFGDTDDGYIDVDKLAWYAYYDTDRLAEQISRKVNRFRKNQTVTELLKRMNKETRIQE